MSKTRNIDLLKKELQMYEQLPEQVKQLNNWSDEEYNEVVSNLRSKIELSKRGKGSRLKGSSYENTVAKVFKDKLDVTLSRTPLSGGFQKSNTRAESFRGDLNCVDSNVELKVHIECKNQKTIAINKWWKQTIEDCPKTRKPLLVIHRNQKIVNRKVVEKAEDFVLMRLSDFLEVVNRDKIIEEMKIKPKSARLKNRKGRN